MSQQATTFRKPQGFWEHAVEFVFVLVGLAFKIAFQVLGITAHGLFKLARVALKSLVSRRKEVQEEGAADVETAKPAETSKPEKVDAERPASTVTVSKAAAVRSAAFTRTITFEKGFGTIMFWFYPGGKVRRLVKIYDRALVERVGFERHELKELSYSGMAEVEIILKQTVAQVNSLLRGKHEVKLRVVGGDSSESSSTDKDVAKMPKPPKTDAGDSAEKSAKRTSQDKGDVAVMPSSFEEAVQVAVGKKRTKPSKVFTGRIIELGEKDRLLNKKKIQQYCVTIESDELNGNAIPIYGTDLERAVDECGATVGSRVRIEHLGRIEWTEPNGREAWKNAYNVALI